MQCISSLDFLIIAQRRSGSHMLASALDSHGDINCYGELDSSGPHYEWLGTGGKNGIYGGVVNAANFAMYYRGQRVIVLTRSPAEIAESCACILDNGLTHATDMSTKKYRTGSYPDIYDAQKRAAEIERIAINIESQLIIDYSQLTGNKHVAVLPRKITMTICDFLNVAVEKLKPAFVKPAYGTA